MPVKLKWITRPLAVLLTLPACALMAACGPDLQPCPTSPVPGGLAVAVGDRANSPKPAWPAELDAELQTLTQTAGPGVQDRGVTLVRADGRPAIGCVLSYGGDEENPEATAHAKNVFLESVQDEAVNLAAAAPEANPLEAISHAAAAAGPGGTVALIDSGLQTVAPLDFRADHLLDKNTDWLVSALVQKHALPDLSGRKVILSGIGYTAPPQAELSVGDRAHLIELWQKIARAAGAREVVIVAKPDTTPPDAGLPDVGEIPIQPPGNPVPDCNQDAVLPDDGAVGFVPGHTEFRHEKQATATLQTISDWLKGHSSAKGKITGSIAHYGSDDGLSKRRADRVRSVLVGLGARPDQLSAAGEGWGPFPSKTAGGSPEFDPLNRRVVISFTCV
ncbi:OmpA family protein [Amycolatopsis sp. NBC_00438]|uniref:OmpA family protein n=1 Tax=Amycolatopsis sp. NBC_00438 TaxID=2903558 RepID=UPI002E227278